MRWIVQPNVVGGWDVRPESSGSHVFRSSGRAEAEAEAHRLADRSGGSAVVLDGRGAVLDTYAPPSAPLPPLATPRPASPREPVAVPATAPGRPAAPPSPPPRPANEQPAAERKEDPLAAFARNVADGTGALGDRVADAAKKDLTGRVDKALDRGFKAWYRRADSGQRFAAQILILSALVGPGGATLVTLVQWSMNPTLSTQIVESLFWLLVLTLPVTAAAGVAVLLLGHTNLGAGMLWVAATAVAAAAVVGYLGVPNQLADVYCYADVQSGHAVYEHACRVMDTQGFLDADAGKLTVGNSATVLGDAFGMVADARGVLMALGGVAAGFSGGYLVRRSA